MPILFVLEFKLGSATRESYEKFIEKLRHKLATRYSQGLPVLAYQQMLPAQFFDVVLRTNYHSVRFRFRGDNLYLVGYQMETTGQWLEFGGDESKNKSQKTKSKKNRTKKNTSKRNDGSAPHLITVNGTESDFLGFSCGYDSLERAARRSLEKIRIGFRSIVKAIDQLAVSTHWETRAHSLIVVIMSISESARLIQVCQHIADSFPNSPGTSTDGAGCIIESWIIKLVQKWNKLSEAALRGDVCPELGILLEDNTTR